MRIAGEPRLPATQPSRRPVEELQRAGEAELEGLLRQPVAERAAVERHVVRDDLGRRVEPVDRPLRAEGARAADEYSVGRDFTEQSVELLNNGEWQAADEHAFLVSR